MALEPLALDHVVGLCRAASIGRNTHALRFVPATLEATGAYVEAALAAGPPMRERLVARR